MSEKMENEYNFMKRGYLLPEGCKDLIDVLRLNARHSEVYAPNLNKGLIYWSKGVLKVPAQMTVAELAAILHQKPFRIIADLMEIGVFANVNQQVDFETISRIVRKYGYTAS